MLCFVIRKATQRVRGESVWYVIFVYWKDVLQLLVNVYCGK